MAFLRGKSRKFDPNAVTPRTVSTSMSGGKATAKKQETKEENDIETTFAKLLQLQLVPGDAQAHLIATLSVEKKEQMISMHSALLGDAKSSAAATWSPAQDGGLLRRIREADTLSEDVGSGAMAHAMLDGEAAWTCLRLLEQLQTRLSTANRDYMKKFVEEEGLSVIRTVADRRLARVPFGDSELRTVDACLNCLKSVVNNAVGMEYFIEQPGCVDLVAECCEPLRQLEPLHDRSLSVLTLTVWASDRGRDKVMRCLERLALKRAEHPLVFARKLLRRGSPLVRVSTMQLLNQLVMRSPTLKSRCSLRNAIVGARIVQVAQHALESTCLDEMEGSDEDEFSDEDLEDEYQEEMITSVSSRPLRDVRSCFDSSLPHAPPEVEPRKGRMMGELTAAKQRSDQVQRFTSFVGSKPTKRRVYKLENGVLSWSQVGEQGAATNTPGPAAVRRGSATSASLADTQHFVDVSEVLFVRNVSNNDSVLEARPFSLELVFMPPRLPLALGCDSEADHDAWFVALRTARRQLHDATSLKRLGEMVSHEEKVSAHAELRKQLEIMMAVSDADRAQTVQSLAGRDFDGASPADLGAFIAHSAAKAGAGEVALKVFHELLMWPVEAALGAKRAWELALDSLRLTREQRQKFPALRDYDTLSQDKSPWRPNALKIADLVKEQNTTLTAALALPPSPRLEESSMKVPGGAPPPTIHRDSDDTPYAPPLTKKYVDPKYDKFIDMVELGVPRMAIDIKMLAEGLDPSSLPDKKELPPQLTVAPVAVVKPPPAAASEKPCLGAIGEDPRVAKYFKMLRMQMPKAAVAHKMEAEGFNSALLDMDPNKPPTGPIEKSSSSSKSPGGTTTASSRKKLPAPPKRPPGAPKLKSLFWQKVLKAELKGTIWEEEAAPDETVFAPSLEALFGEKASKVKEQKEKAPAEKGKVELVEGKRRQNVEIGLARVKLSHEAVRDAMNELDFQTLPSLNDASGLSLWIRLSPTLEEAEAVMSYVETHGVAAPRETLGSCEHFFYVLAKGVTRLQPRLAALQATHILRASLADLDGKINALHRGADCLLRALVPVRGSDNNNKNLLVGVLRVCLRVGNKLNEYTTRGEAAGFRPEILPKLAQVKSSDPQRSLLHYVADLAEEKYGAETLQALWAGLLADIGPAASVDVAEVQTELLRLQAMSRNLVETEIENAGPGKFREHIAPLGASCKAKHATVTSKFAFAKQTILLARRRLGGIEESEESESLRTLFKIFKEFGEDFEKARATSKRLRDKAAREAAGPLRIARRPLPTKTPSPTASSDDLFATFNKIQKQSANEIIKNFTRQNNNSSSSSNSDDEVDDDDFDEFDEPEGDL